MKDKSVVVKWKLHQAKKKPHYIANTLSTFYKHLHREHANAKLAQYPE